MFLSDCDLLDAIRCSQLIVDPLLEGSVQPASVELHLSPSFRRYRSGITVDSLAPNPDDTTLHTLQDGRALVVLPGEFLLLATREFVMLSPEIVGRVEGKSSLGRIGLMVHITAGFIDPGFQGHLTLEIKNLSNNCIKLHAGQPIAQLSIARLISPAERPYGSPGLGSHYQGQTGPTPAHA